MDNCPSCKSNECIDINSDLDGPQQFYKKCKTCGLIFTTTNQALTNELNKNNFEHNDNLLLG